MNSSRKAHAQIVGKLACLTLFSILRILQFFWDFQIFALLFKGFFSIIERKSKRRKKTMTKLMTKIKKTRLLK